MMFEFNDMRLTLWESKAERKCNWPLVIIVQFKVWNLAKEQGSEKIFTWLGKLSGHWWRWRQQQQQNGTNGTRWQTKNGIVSSFEMIKTMIFWLRHWNFCSINFLLALEIVPFLDQDYNVGVIGRVVISKLSKSMIGNYLKPTRLASGNSGKLLYCCLVYMTDKGERSVTRNVAFRNEHSSCNCGRIVQVIHSNRLFTLLLSGLPFCSSGVTSLSIPGKMQRKHRLLASST